jgi:hypothetical protein
MVACFGGLGECFIGLPYARECTELIAVEILFRSALGGCNLKYYRVAIIQFSRV